MEGLEHYFSWHFIELDDPKDYTAFISARIKVYWNNYPDNEAVKKLIKRKNTKDKGASLSKRKRKNRGA